MSRNPHNASPRPAGAANPRRPFAAVVILLALVTLPWAGSRLAPWLRPPAPPCPACAAAAPSARPGDSAEGRRVGPPQDSPKVAAWIPALPAPDRSWATEGTLAPAAAQPETARPFAQVLATGEAPLVREYGRALVQMLGNAGHHAAALDFALAGGPEKADWTTHALELWLQHDPDGAQAALLAFAEHDYPEAAADEAFRRLEARFARSRP